MKKILLSLFFIVATLLSPQVIYGQENNSNFIGPPQFPQNTTQNNSFNSQKTLKILGVDLGCVPSNAPNPDIVGSAFGPNVPGAQIPGCGLVHFAYLIKVIIDFLSKVVVLPLATLMIIWGGFKIIMGRGNSSELLKGKQIITTALIGVVIVFSASIIVSLIWKLLSNNPLPNP